MRNPFPLTGEKWRSCSTARCENGASSLPSRRNTKPVPGNTMSRFWTTETSARAKGRKAYPPQGGKQGPFTVLIDFRERYPYRFPGCVTERQNLPAGDYGLFQEGCLIAVVERKTPENFLSPLRLALQELRTFPYRAVVLECSCGDLLNPRENRFYPPAISPISWRNSPSSSPISPSCSAGTASTLTNGLSVF